MKVQTHFDNHKLIIEKELKEAKEKILIAVAWINFKEYFDLFKLIRENLVELKIICSDNWQNRSHQAEINELSKLGAEIKLLKMPKSTNHMHHKFAIIDNETILNGSFNWSPNATSSFENIIVIKEAKDEVSKFISEFEKLYNIESKTIKELQKITKCSEPNCNGELFNLLIFSERSSKYFELYGDIIEVCTSCDKENKIIENCIPNNQIEFMINAYKGSSDDFETELIDRSINSLLDSYVKHEITIHAIGRVNSGLRHRHVEFTETNIIWKNKFVGDRLPDKFEDTNFGVVYDN